MLMAQCATTIKKVSLELGVNTPFIVFDDADLDAAVEGTLGSKFRNTGQTFGLLEPIFRFNSEAEAITMANDTEFGLASYLYTRDLGRAWRVSEVLEYGMAGVNEGLISTEVAPFGGIKQSGLGRKGSKYAIDDYIEQKYMCIEIN